MSKFGASMLVLVGGLTSHPLIAQISPTPFLISVAPTNGTLFIEETTNSIFVTITNFTNYANLTLDSLPFITNFLDDGVLPDLKSNDGIFAGQLLTPRVVLASNLILNIRIAGFDLALTNDASMLPTNLFNTVTVTSMTYIVVARPPNDRFSNAIKIASAGEVAVGSNNFGSLELDEPVHGGVADVSASVWWNWSAPANTNVLIDTAGSSFHPILAVYRGENLGELALVDASTNDVRNGLQANVVFPATKGTTYRIAVSGIDTNVGSIRLRVVPGGEPDIRPPSVSIISPSRESLTTSSNLFLFGTASEPLATDSGISNVVLQVNNGPITNANGTLNWAGAVSVPPGTNVVRAFAIDYAGNVSPPDTIIVRFINPTNDLFASAGRLSGTNGFVTALNAQATKEPGEQLHGDNEGGRSIWYSFRAPLDGTLSLNTIGSNFDTLLGLYLGDQVTNLIQIASNDDAFPGSLYSQITQNVASNRLYYIAVDGFGGASGTVVLQFSFAAPVPVPLFNLTIQALPGGRVSPPSGLYPADSPLTLTATPDPNFEFVGWEGSIMSSSNPLTLLPPGDLVVIARFRGNPLALTDDFETGALSKLPWFSPSSAAWQAQTNVVSSGKFAARSGPIGNNSQSSLILVTNTLAGPAAFDARVSSEEGWDFLEFYLNNRLLIRWSGEVDWLSFSFALLAGTNRLEWRYIKDANFSSGLDAAFIDNLFIPLGFPSTTNVAARLTIAFSPDRQPLIQVNGQPHRDYRIEFSTNAIVWLPFSVRNSDNGVIQFSDPDSGRFRMRFFRAIAQ